MSAHARRAAEWRAFTARLARYTPLPAERFDPPGGGAVLWSFAKRAVVVEPPEIAAALGPWAGVWYAARRDASLLGTCPICDATSLVTDMSVEPMHAAMEHRPHCPIGDDAARRLIATPFPSYRKVATA